MTYTEKKSILFLLFVLFSLFTDAQVGINAAGSPSHPSAMLDVESTEKGLLPPRLTSVQRDAISSPAHGLRIYNSDTGCENFYSGVTNRWMALCGVCSGPVAPTSGTHSTTATQIVWNWNTVSGAAGYKWNTINNYLTATDATSNTSYTQTGLTAATTYTLYVWSYDVLCGGSETPTTLTASTPCSESLTGPGGGKIFYCGSAYLGYSGLVAAPSDQSGGAQWGCAGSQLSGANGEDIGTGNQNTTDIMNGCGTSDIAARICGDLVLGGFSDWFLPSANEMNAMDGQIGTTAGFSNSFYWSSTETSSANAWGRNFVTGSSTYDGNKNNSWRVRCVRRF